MNPPSKQEEEWGEDAKTGLATLQVSMLRDALGSLPRDTRILDVGCGNGNIVQEWLDLGFDAHGCDFRFKHGPRAGDLQLEGRIGLIAPSPYRLPFPDASFDVVVTNQVLEHVRDYPATLAEMRRVLKPGGWCLHIFPARGMPIEPHTFVPLAAVIQRHWWLALWARLGIRRGNQIGKDWRSVAAANYAYLTSNTNYLSGCELRRGFSARFGQMRYAERLFLKHSPNRRGRTLYRLGCAFPPLFLLYRRFWSRVVLARA